MNRRLFVLYKTAEEDYDLDMRYHPCGDSHLNGGWIPGLLNAFVM